MINKKNIILSVIVLIILAALLYNTLFQKSAQPSPILEEEEEEKIIIPKVLYNMSGIIQELGGDFFVLEASISELDENGQPSKKIEIRKVLVSSNTEFSRLDFVAVEGENRRSPKETSISFRDLKAGDFVEVISKRDISQAQEFEVSKVKILPN